MSLIIPEPFYANYNSFAMAAGVTVVPLRTVIEDGFTLPPISAFEIPSRHAPRGSDRNRGNPTGRIMEKTNWTDCATS